MKAGLCQRRCASEVRRWFCVRQALRNPALATDRRATGLESGHLARGRFRYRKASRRRHRLVETRRSRPLSARRAIGFTQERSPAEPDSALSPAAVVSELELSGYIIRRVDAHGRLVGVRLLEPGPLAASSAPRWRQVTQVANCTTSRGHRGLPGPGLAFPRRRLSLAFRARFGSEGSARGRVDALVAIVPADAIPRRGGRRATLPRRHRSGVGGSLTRTPLRRAYRLQRPCHFRSLVLTLGARNPGRP